MGKKKIFVTKKITNWKILDKIIIFIIIGINLFDLLKANSDEVFKGIGDNQSFIVYLLLGIFVLLVIFIKSLPLLAIYFALKFAIKKYRISSATFNASNDIEYYREMFDGISPATMSLLMDLGLETEKDLGAMKLYYELNNVYLYEIDGSLYLNNPNNIKINKSDDILLNYFYKNKKNVFLLNEWKENVICENVNNGLIRRKYKEEKKKNGCGFFVLIYIITLVIMGYVLYDFVLNVEVLEKFNQVLESSPQDNMGFLNYIADNEEFINTMMKLLVFAVCFFIHFWNVIASIIYLFTINTVKVKDKIKRTDRGDFLAEKLYGMKNFIKDFSNLDEASKKHLVLWKEFLIYAVVLEENNSILDEISGTYHINLVDYKNYRS